MTRKHVAAMRRTERQRQHRIRTGGLIARAHVEHERGVPDSRHPSIILGEAFLGAWAKRTAGADNRRAPDAEVPAIEHGIAVPFGFDIVTDETLPPDVIEIQGETTVRVKIGCPRCGAVGLDPCRKPNGRVADKAHAGRVTS